MRVKVMLNLKNKMDSLLNRFEHVGELDEAEFASGENSVASIYTNYRLLSRSLDKG